MPTSPYVHIQTFVNYLTEIRPKSILDVGLGNGKLGFVARDLLDVMLGQRYRREEWQTRIDGVEVFPDYIQGYQKLIYDNIYVGDAWTVLPGLGMYELIVLGDVLEHFDKERAWAFLDRCMNRVQNHLILNLPLGDNWVQPEIYNNPYEKHRSAWTWEDVSPFVWKYKFFQFQVGTYSCLLLRKEDYVAYRYEQYMQASQNRCTADVSG